METVFFCSACGDTKHVQSCSGRGKPKNSSMDGVHVYKLLESVMPKMSLSFIIFRIICLWCSFNVLHPKGPTTFSVVHKTS